MSDIIFHHYDSSPFSEKVRVVFGMKNLTWNSVEIPVIMPKPDLMPLTGGYRKTPVMQIGADIYCDTQIILREIERRFPSPSLTKAAPGLAYGIALWTDRPFFQATIPILFGEIADFVTDEFKKDREALFPGRPFDTGEMKRAAPIMREQWRAQLAWIDDQLADGRPYLFGDAPDLSDASAYMNVWFLRNGHRPSADRLMQPFAHATAWADRIAGLGHGTRKPMTGAEALDIAKAAKPTAQTKGDAGEPNGWQPGQKVTVQADDYGRDPIAGEIVSISPHHVAIRRSDPRVGDVVVHFPRAGFWIMPS